MCLHQNSLCISYLELLHVDGPPGERAAVVAVSLLEMIPGIELFVFLELVAKVVWV